MKKRLEMLLLAATVLACVHAGRAFTVGQMFPELMLESGLMDQAAFNAKLAAEPVLGEWSIGFSKCKAYAEANGVPMFMIWSSTSCGHCNAFDKLFISEMFKDWAAANKVGKVVLCFSDQEIPGEGENSEAYNWSGGTGGSWYEGQFPWQGYLLNYPFVAFYWPANRIDYHCSGADLSPEWYTDDERLQYVFAAFEKWFAGYEPGGEPNKYGGVFAVGTDVYARLEAQPGFTTSIDVPLVRTNSVDSVGTNWLAWVYGNTTSDFHSVAWAAGEDRVYPRLSLPTGYKEGDTIGLVLMTGGMEEVCDTGSIFCTTVENSPSNPHWLGERSPESLSFGEWTMDYAIATNKVALWNEALAGKRSSAGKKAYTLLLLEGALWCPDCIKTDEHFLEYIEPGTGEKPFRKWAEENNIALVALDVPNLRSTATAGDHPDGDDYPALLKYDAFEKLGALRSGAGYLSRHMISNEVAAASLAASIAKAGELRRPDWTTNPYRPGVPTIFILKEDGSVAARFTAFGVAGPAEYKACFIERLNEMLASAEDPCEEDNALWSTLPEDATVPAHGSVVNTICASDLTDAWRIDGAGQLVKATFKSDSSAQIAVSMFMVDDDGNVSMLANPASGDLAEGVTVEAVCPETGDTYVSISGSGAGFDVYSESSTLREYVLATKNVLIPSETIMSYGVHEAEDTIAIRLEKGNIYYVGGVSGPVAEGAVARVGYNLYKALSGADVEFSIPDGASTVAYGIATESIKAFRDVEFSVKSYPNARLEVEAGKTQWVDVPVVLTNGTSSDGINLVVGVFGGESSTQTVEWASVEGGIAFARLGIPASIKSGDAIELQLRTLAGELLETSSITCVEPVENSSVNPYWIGEKTAETLGFGEWTMDISAVTGKVARYKAANPSGKAYAIMVVQGSLWCPNCWKMETNLWDRAEVKRWAVENNVVFGVVDIDIPPFEYGNYPTLLTYDTFKLDHAPGTEMAKYHSGAGYISRHSVPYEDAVNCRLRNSALVTGSTADGGWCRPERMNKEWKTGLPMILLMREDGSIAGRYDRFNTEGPEEFSQYLIYRLDELLATVEDVREENNADWRTSGARESIHADDSVQATLSANDRVDTYRLVGSDMRISVSVTGPQAADVEVKLIDVDQDGVESIIASEIGDLSSGIVVTNQIGALDNVFIVVSGLAATTFSPLSDGRTTRNYTLATTSVLIPGGDVAEYHAAGSVDSVTVFVKEGHVYYFDGISTYDEDVFERGEGNLYYCKKTAETKVVLTQAGGSFLYGSWESGSFGFTQQDGDETSRLWLERPVYEAADGQSKKVPITVHRNGSTFGPAAIWVRLLASSTSVTDRYEWVDQKVEWASGVGGDKTVYITLNNDDVYDPPPQTLIFALEADEGTSAEIEQGYGILIFSIEDDDTIRAGRLAITDASPAWSRNMTIIAEEGSTISFVVSRENGTSGDVTGRLSLKTPGAAPIYSSEAKWENRTRMAERILTLKVPSYETAKTALVTLIPGDGIEADPKRRSVTVQIVPASVPCFVAEDGRRDLLSWIGSAVSDSISVSNLVGYGAVSVSKVSGSLPSGVTISYDKDAEMLVLAGAPKREGYYTAVYRVSQMQNGRLVRGRTVSINISVMKIDASWFDGSNLNPALRVSRNYRNIMIVAQDDGDSKTCLRGILTLSLPVSGRLSAKYICESGTYSYVADGWGDVDSETGDLTATLVCTRYDMSDRTLAVVAAFDGTVTVSLCDIDDPSVQIVAEAIPDDWSEENPATAWGGQYNVMLAQATQAGSPAPIATGYGYMSLRMTDDAAKSGQMLFAGCLPDGRAFSGSSVLLAAKAFGPNARMPFFAASSGETVSGALDIQKNAKTGNLTASVNQFVTSVASAPPCWRGAYGSDSSCVPGRDWKTYLSGIGGYYDCDYLCMDCSRRFATGLYFLTGAASFQSAFYGNATAIPGVEVAIAGQSIDIVSPEANVNRLRLAFDHDTGVFSGTLRVDFSSMSKIGTFRGVIIPGWGGCDECGRLGPLGAGALWFTDYLDEYGTLSAKGGFAVEINNPE